MGRRVEGDGMPKDAAVEEFAGLVRALKARDGRSYEALGRRLSVSASTLHRYCSGATVPEEFAVVDRLALLCGADEEERRALEAAWTEADRARRRAASPAPTPVPAVSAAPESNPEPSAPEAPGARPRRGAPAPLLVAAAVALVVLALAAALLGHPTRTASAPAPASTAPGRTAAPLPFTWSIGSQLWEGGCGHTYLVDRAPARSPRRRSRPTPGRGPGRTVPCTAGRRWCGSRSRAGRRPTPSSSMPCTCAWSTAPRRCRGTRTGWTTAVAAPSPHATSPWTSTGRARSRGPSTALTPPAQGPEDPAVSFPYKVTSSDPEELLVSARTAGCDCRWYLELEWSAGGRTGTVRITDGGSRSARAGPGEAGVRARLRRRALDHRLGLWTDRVTDE